MTEDGGLPDGIQADEAAVWTFLAPCDHPGLVHDLRETRRADTPAGIGAWIIYDPAALTRSFARRRGRWAVSG